MLKTIFVVSILFIFMSCSQADKQVRIKIIATADVHAVVFPHDFINDEPMDGSLAHVKTYVDAQRSLRGQNVILLDNGDILQGQPTGYFFNYVSQKPEHFFAQVMNMMEFDAASVGNHDIETGHEVYNRLKDDFDFPWLAANILDQRTGEPYFEPYTIIEKQGVRVAVLGLVTASVPNWLPAKLWENLEFVNMYDAAKEWMTYILENENPHAVVGLFHSGAGPDMDYQGEPAELENASLFVAGNIPGFDVVFTAHDHQVRNKTIENVKGDEVMVIAGQPFGRSLAVAEFYFMPDEENGFTIARRSGDIVDMDKYNPCDELLTRFQEEYQQVTDFVNESVGELEKDIFAREAYKGNAAFVDFIHNIQMALTDAEISFAAPLSFDAVLKEGALTRRDMFRLYPFENYLYVMELTGREIQDALEYSYSLWFNTMGGPDDHLMLLRKDEEGDLVPGRSGRARFDNVFYNFDSAAGIDYTVDVSRPAGERINITGLSNGKSFQENVLYKVAINSYRGSGGGGHLTSGAGIEHSELENRIVWVSDGDLRGHISDHIAEKGTLRPSAGNNWKVIPVEWAEEAAKRDYTLLFSE